MRCRLVECFAIIFGWLWYTLIRTRRQEVLNRVQIRLKMELPQAKDLTKRVYRNLARSLVELFVRGGLKKGHWPIEVRGWAHMKKLHESGQGYVVVTAHLGNWELLTHLAYVCGVPGGFVSKRFKLRGFQLILDWLRRDSNTVMGIHGAAKEIVRRVERGEAVGFAVDQHSNEQSAVALPFLGAAAWWSTAPARVSRMTGCPIVPIHTFFENARHVVEIGAPYTPNWNGSRVECQRDAAAWYARTVEIWVKRHPAQWLWLHRRWKPQRQPKLRAEGR